MVSLESSSRTTRTVAKRWAELHPPFWGKPNRSEAADNIRVGYYLHSSTNPVVSVRKLPTYSLTATARLNVDPAFYDETPHPKHSTLREPIIRDVDERAHLRIGKIGPPASSKLVSGANFLHYVYLRAGSSGEQRHYFHLAASTGFPSTPRK